MTSTYVDLPPIDVQKSLISDNLNSTFLSVLLIGIYTVVYVQTVYIYLSTRMAGRSIVIMVISALYLLTLASVSIQWYYTSFIFVNNSDTRESLFIASFMDSPTALMISTVMQMCTFNLADGLMVWRCSRILTSLKVRIVVYLMFFAEICLSVVATILSGILLFDPAYATEKQARLVDIINGSLSSVTAAVSLLATGMIAYSIMTTTSYDKGSRRRYTSLLEILIQSSMIYTITVIILAITDLVQFQLTSANSALATMNYYFSAIVCIVTGLAPTMMVARVCLAKGSTNRAITVNHVSELQFHVQSTTSVEP